MAMTKAERAAKAREYLAVRRARRRARGVVARASDPSVPGSELSPLEAAAREVRLRLIEQAGGLDRIPITKVWQADVLVVRHLLLGAVQQDVLHLAEKYGLVNLRARREHPVLACWLRMAGDYERALQAFGLEGAKPKEQTLADILGEYERGEAPTQRAQEPPQHNGAAPEPECASQPAVVEPGVSGAGQPGGNGQAGDLVEVHPPTLGPGRVRQAEVERAGLRVVETPDLRF